MRKIEQILTFTEGKYIFLRNYFYSDHNITKREWLPFSYMRNECFIIIMMQVDEFYFLHTCWAIHLIYAQIGGTFYFSKINKASKNKLIISGANTIGQLDCVYLTCLARSSKRMNKRTDWCFYQTQTSSMCIVDNSRCISGCIARASTDWIRSRCTSSQQSTVRAT